MVLDIKIWPVPSSYTLELPSGGAPGSFWEDRGDRFHCGVDIYAPEGSDVVAVADGVVTGTGDFTSPEWVGYWNATFWVLVRHEDGYFSKYAELGEVLVSGGQEVKAGQTIGRVGQVLNPDRVVPRDPGYVIRLAQAGNSSMLHFELHQGEPEGPDDYLGGNVFSSDRPEGLADPTEYLRMGATASLRRER